MDERKPAQNNPPWSRDELILALDLYLRHRESLPGKNTDAVQELSAFLGRMSKALAGADAPTFRNPNGVYMKLGNFRRWDPEYTQSGKSGLAKGNKDEGVVWAEFANDPAMLEAVVERIRATVESDDDEATASMRSADEPDIHEAAEGRVLTRLHRTRERSRKLVEAKKRSVLAVGGRLACEACGFDFGKFYGALAEGIIEVHHTRPVHTLLPGDKTHLDDLALLCANCHRVVHSSRRWLSVDQVRSLVEEATP